MHQSGHPARSRPPAADGRSRRGRSGLEEADGPTRPQVPPRLTPPRIVAADRPADAPLLPARAAGHAAAGLQQQQPRELGVAPLPDRKIRPIRSISSDPCHGFRRIRNFRTRLSRAKISSPGKNQSTQINQEFPEASFCSIQLSSQTC